MYGIGRKNDIYKKSKWSSDTESKSLKSKSDLDINSESEYEESKSEIYEKPSNNDYFSKIFAVLNEIKTLTDKNSCEKQICENPNTSDKLSLEKLDNILEYIKTIDSDSKNTYELLKHINLKQSDIIEKESKTSDEEGFTTEQLKEIIKNELMNNKTASELDDHIIALLTNHYNKIRLKMDNIPSKLDVIHGDMDILYNKIDYINQNQTQLLNIINKLTSDNLFLRLHLEQTSQKLDQLINSVDYLHQQAKISTCNNTSNTSNNYPNSTHICNTSIPTWTSAYNTPISKIVPNENINTIDMINNIDCKEVIQAKEVNDIKEEIEEYISVAESGSQELIEECNENSVENVEHNENSVENVENIKDEKNEKDVKDIKDIKDVKDVDIVYDVQDKVIEKEDEIPIEAETLIKNIEEKNENIDIKIEIPSDETFFKPASIRSVTKRIVRKKK